MVALLNLLAFTDFSLCLCEFALAGNRAQQNLDGASPCLGQLVWLFYRLAEQSQPR